MSPLPRDSVQQPADDPARGDGLEGAMNHAHDCPKCGMPDYAQNVNAYELLSGHPKFYFECRVCWHLWHCFH